MVPTAAQKRELKSCFAAARWAYNRAVEMVNKGEVRPNFIALRNAVAAIKERPPCCAGVHNKIIARAVKQAADAFATNFKKMEKQGNTYKFKVKFRSFKRNYMETVIIERAKEGPLGRFEAMAAPAGKKRRHTARTECLVHFGASLKKMGGVRLQDKDEVIGRMLSEGNFLQEDAKILWDKRDDSFKFVYTYVLPALEDPDPSFATKSVLSGDMGVHPFVEFYQPDGTHGSVLDGIAAEVEGRCASLDALDSRVHRRERKRSPRRRRARRRGAARRKDVRQRRPRSRKGRQRRPKADWPAGQKKKTSPGRRRRQTNRRLRAKLARDRLRLHNWVEGAHYDACNFLLARADVLVVPKIASKRMSEKKLRNISSRTVRSMLTLSPGRFCERLASCAAKYAGRHVLLDTGEPGTSKTVGCCGWWDAGLAVRRKTCACPLCKVSIDRQVNGARNNLLAALGKAVGIGWDGVHG